MNSKKIYPITFRFDEYHRNLLHSNVEFRKHTQYFERKLEEDFDNPHCLRDRKISLERELNQLNHKGSKIQQRKEEVEEALTDLNIKLATEEEYQVQLQVIVKSHKLTPKEIRWFKNMIDENLNPFSSLNEFKENFRHDIKSDEFLKIHRLLLEARQKHEVELNTN